MYGIHWLAIVLLCLVNTEQAKYTEDDSLRIGAFNVQMFGAKKASKDDVMNALAKIIQRYDIMLIQEIRDSSGKAIVKLHEMVNDKGPGQYSLILGERLGRSNSKEQYAYFYRPERVQAVDQYQWPDRSDKFERPPFSVLFSPKLDSLAVKRFAVVGVHIDPDMVQEEMDALLEVHDGLATYWDTDNIVLMGDMNADCSYLSQTRSKKLLLRSREYTWLIGSDADTTTKSTHCAYDRIIISGNELPSNVVDDKGDIFKFDQTFGYDTTLTTAISDHYPVEFVLSNVMTSGDVTEMISTLRQLLVLLQKLVDSGNLPQ